MCLHFSSRNMISEIQEKFHDAFPDLKLEFSFCGKEKIRPSNGRPHAFPYVSIEELCIDPQCSELDIEDDMTVAEVEDMFHRLFDLPAQVFLKSGEYWTRTKSLENWKLKH